VIIVTGATGALNGATVEGLLERVPPAEIAVAVRDKTKAQHLADRGVAVREADYERPQSLPAAFEGADQLLLVSINDPAADAVALHRAAIDGAVEAGIGRILYTSHQGAAPDTPFGPGRDHYATEQYLAETGVAWTSLRNGFYAHSIGWLAGNWRETGVISVPADGPVSWTAREDAAEAAAIILTAPAPYEGPVTITAPAAPTFEDLAAIASELAGRQVDCVVVGADRWAEDKMAAGMPEMAVRFTLGMYEAAAGGFFAGVDPLLGELLGREPRPARQALATPAAH
jgi:NAD(P)H dehydrogenase (quinone)